MRSNYSRCLVVFLRCLILLCVLLQSVPHTMRAVAIDAPPDVDAASAIVMDADSDSTFFALNVNERRAPASTTKLLTCLVAIRAIRDGEVSLYDSVTASDNAWFDLSWDSSTSNIQAGEVMSLENLLYCAMVHSANEACNIIAEYIAGSVSAFTERMNALATELGCTGSNFVNVHGLPNSEHYTTAYDLALIARAALKEPELVKIANTVTYTVPATNKSKERKLTNTNFLIRTNNKTYYYPDAIGLKTGSTSDAGFCLVSSANKDGIRVVAVVLGAKAVETEPGVFITQSFTISKSLYEWFYSNFEYRDVVKTSDLIASVPVKFGRNADEVLLKPATPLALILPQLSDDDTNTADPIEREIVLFDEQLIAPVESGMQLGELVLSYNGHTYAPIPLLATATVTRDGAAYMKNEIAQTLKKPAVWGTIVIIVVVLASLFIAILRYRAKQLRRRREQARRNRPQRVVYDD